jgi:protein ImuA
MLAIRPPSTDPPPVLARMPLGAPPLDAALGGGLALAGLHELHGTADAAAAVTGLAARLAAGCGRPGPVLWLRERGAADGGRLYGLGLADLGLDPARLLLVEAPDTIALLRAAAEALTCAGLACVVVESWGRAPAIDLTASRRLQLAAARVGLPCLLLRLAGEQRPSAALTRWQVAPAPSTALAADAPGWPRLALTLSRQRGGQGAQLAGQSHVLEWMHEQPVSSSAPHPRARAALSRHRAAGRQRAA